MRKKHSVGYFSSYDRGLNYLLGIWPEIRKAVPDATLDIYYGWNSYDKMHSTNPQQMRWKLQMIRELHKLKDQGVTEHGRVGHETLSKAMKELEVWAYPTGFPEINCITALRTQAAGMTPITTGYAALQETVDDVEKDWGEAIYDDANNKDVIADFTARLINALKFPESEQHRQERAKIIIDKYNWATIAKEWNKVMA